MKMKKSGPHDGAIAHTSRCSIGINFERVVYWMPSHFTRRHYMDSKFIRLSPCDFFLWEHLKDQLYNHRPTSLQALKEVITKVTLPNRKEHEELWAIPGKAS